MALLGMAQLPPRPPLSCRAAAAVCPPPNPLRPSSMLTTKQAANLDAVVKDLLQPTSVLGAPCQGGPLPALATLPPSAHLNLLLLLRAAPHRFSAAQQAALLQGLQHVAAASAGANDPQHASLVQLLAAEAEGSLIGQPAAAAVVPPCPSFLYTAQPCFPWAPVLTDAATAAALHKRQLKEARRREQQEQEARQAAGDAAAGGAAAAAAAAPGGKRPAADETSDASPAKRPRPAVPPGAATTTAGAAAAAEAELDAAVSAVQAALVAHAAGGAGELTAVPPPLRAALDVLLLHAAAGSTSGSKALDEAGLSRLDDDSLLLLLLSELIGPASSFARCRAAAAGLLLPRLSELAGPAPQDLAAATQHAGGWLVVSVAAALLRIARTRVAWHVCSELVAATLGRMPACPSQLVRLRHHGLRLSPVVPRYPPCPPLPAASANPQAFTAACLRPLLSSPGLNKHQAELLSAVLKASIPPALLPEVLAAACAAPTNGPGAAAGGAGWDEHTVGVLQVALNAKPPMGSAAVAQLAGACGAAAAASVELAGSAKLAKLLLSLVKQYPSEAAECKQQLQAAAQATKSFMTKSLLAAVAKL